MSFTMNNELTIQEKRLLDPINYKEACYRLVWEKRYKNFNIDDERIICWLGSNIGQCFLKDVQYLIDQYPYKEKSSFVYMNGCLVDELQFLLHCMWFIEQRGKMDFSDAKCWITEDIKAWENRIKEQYCKILNIKYS
jgi:hypothetical protein